jgi:hypothetical protein
MNGDAVRFPFTAANDQLGEAGLREPVPFAFAWSQAENVPLILGQVNFFLKFDVSFYRTQLAFDVRLVA